MSSLPTVEKHGYFYIVRDDLLPGGSKSRFVDQLFNNIDELVYATPAEGGAQTALAMAANRLGKKLTLFAAARSNQHDRVILSKKLGANVVEITPGYLSVVQKRAEQYTFASRMKGNKVDNLKFGLDSVNAVHAIYCAASLIPQPTELWFAAGSGTLARGLAKAWPNVRRCAVMVGHKLSRSEVGGADLFVYPKKFGYAEVFDVSFPCDPHYDLKAYKMMVERGSKGATFWNVAGPANIYKGK